MDLTIHPPSIHRHPPLRGLLRRLRLLHQLERRFDLDQTKIIHVSVGLAVVGLLFHELRPYKRQAGLTFSKEHAEEEWKAREAEIAAAKTKKKK